jgi:hypothetical protein
VISPPRGDRYHNGEQRDKWGTNKERKKKETGNKITVVESSIKK